MLRRSIGVRALACLALACPALLGFGGTSHAQQPTKAQVAAVRSACPADYRAHCASVPPGGAASLACLKQNLASLSASCQKAVTAATGGAPAPAAAAAPAAAPAGAQPAAAPAAAAPAPAPAAAAPAAAAPAATPGASLTPRQELAVLRIGCGPDVRTLCPGVMPGGGRIVGCLMANRAALSPRCTKAIQAVR